MVEQVISKRNGVLWVGLIIVGLLITGCNTQVQSAGNFAQVLAGMAYAEGVEVYFTHTEASDPAIAEKLTNMMKSPVLLVPALAQVPDSALALVYVFENGVVGKGPLGFQPDVFNNPPETEGYSQLRKIILVNWAEGVEPVVIKSEKEIIQAESDAKLTTSSTGVVVNMPFVVWDGGKR